MLKTNSKKAKNNIQQYIIDNYEIDRDIYNGVELLEDSNFKNVAKNIIKVFSNEMLKYNRRYQAGLVCKQGLFIDWLQGLPSILDTSYLFGDKAKNDLANILEETKEEANKYTNEKAWNLMNYLITREILKHDN